MFKIGPSSFKEINNLLTRQMKVAPLVEVGEWQSLKGDIPQTKTRELTDVVFEWNIPNSVPQLQKEVQPNLPWAEEHFGERVSGVPYNPPPSHVRWPFAQKDNDQHRKDKQFSHTYPERFWPRYEAPPEFSTPADERQGIRYRYGDLDDVVTLLQKSPFTRQAYLPVWFPEDTGAHHGERVPCTLGYHFLRRGGYLSCRYFIRSCDFLRHFRDDVYMAARLTQWIANELEGVQPGNLNMYIGSLHIFEGEQDTLQVEDDDYEYEYEYAAFAR